LTATARAAILGGMIDHFALSERLTKNGQGHLLAGIERLEEATRNSFIQRLSDVDWEELHHQKAVHPAGDISSSRVVDLAERGRRRSQLQPLGEAAYRAGKVAVLMVAGGQGTRLGLSGPKGCFAVMPHSHKSIYQLQAEKVLSLSRRLGRDVPFLVMTSPMTDAETRDFFAAHGYFGLKPDQVRRFSQGTVPSLDQHGRALLEGPGKLLENPDGHGGCFTALVKSGNLERLAREGIEHIAYIQVDNLTVPIDDPMMIGLAIAERTDVITKVLEKANPDEKVGHLVRVGSHDAIIEYTELTPEQTRQKNANGELIYRWGSPAIHCWSVRFLSALAKLGYQLPLHRSAKPLKAWIDGKTQEVKGWKSERFIFDLIPQANNSIGLAIVREEEFAPVKNASGVDSAESAVRLASDLYAAWLREAGVKVSLPERARIEIGPLFAATQAQLVQGWDRRVAEITGDFYLEEARGADHASRA
jgi:UDP-N-acetylglucosamine/UDP-N-acetylgalactosamine diphosphorylase